MIRRDDGHDWLLIPQIDHAHLAADLADAWGNDDVPPLPGSPELLAAIRHHDDGWQNWDSAPRIEREAGRPRSFTEMPMSFATDIWSRSIERCRDHGPESGICVSKHFCWLAEQVRESRRDEPDEREALNSFLDAQERLQQTWRHTIPQQDLTAEKLNERIESGYLAIQFFDRISLWICCASRTEPFEIDCPNFCSIQFTPRKNSKLAIKPYPLAVEPLLRSNQPLELSVSAKRIPARKYTDDADLQNTLDLAAEERLSWTITAW